MSEHKNKHLSHLYLQFSKDKYLIKSSLLSVMSYYFGINSLSMPPATHSLTYTPGWCPVWLWPLAVLIPNYSNLQFTTFQTDILSACWNLHSCSLDGEHNTAAAGRDSHRCVTTTTHTDRGRGRHQSFTNSFKCERVLVVSAKGGRCSWPVLLNERRAERRMGGEGPPHHRDPSFWVSHLNPPANTPGRPTRWRQY